MLSGRQVPLAEAGGRVAVPLQRLRERLAVLRQVRRVARERPGELADHAEAHRVVVAPGHQRRPRRRAERRRVEAVVREPARGQPVERRRADRPAERARVAEARIVGQDEQDVRRTLGGGNRRNVVPVRLRAVERSLHHPLKRRTPDRQLACGRCVWSLTRGHSFGLQLRLWSPSCCRAHPPADRRTSVPRRRSPA